MKKSERRKAAKVRFSISAKLILIITFIVIMSLGSITALVSYLVRADLQVMAEENNFEVNRRSASEAEIVLSNIQSFTRMFIRSNRNDDFSNLEQLSMYFFQENSSIASLFFMTPAPPSADSQENAYAEQFLLNDQYFVKKDISPFLAETYRDKNRSMLRRAAAGDTLILNAAPHFRSPMLALFFPYESGGIAVLFSPDALNESFGYGANQSFLINDTGDLLIHADSALVQNGMNTQHTDFIRAIQNAPERNKQQLIHADFSFGTETPPEIKQHIVWEYWDIAKNFTLNVVVPYIEKIIAKGRAIIFGPEANNNSTSIDQAEALSGVESYVAFTKLNTGACIVITGIEYDKVFEGIAATTRRNIYLTVVVLSVSIILIWFFAKGISEPLKDLARAAYGIESGKFDITLRSYKGQDEIGVLNASFQKMTSALNIFGKFTNRDLAVKAMRGELKPGGLPKHATIFFSDIRGFTEKSETFTKAFGGEASDRIVFWLNDYLSKMVECVEKANGVVDKFIGDAVMAHWGTAYTTGSPQKDALNCVLSALMMRKILYEENKKRPPNDPGNPYIRIGCGINTGIVTAGQIGSDLRMEYTVIGDPVNLASRIEALNKPLGTDILISENTWDLVSKYVITEEMPPVTVKGKEKPLRIFAVINLAGITTGPQTLAQVRKLLGIEAPDIAKVDVNAGEEKFAIVGKEKKVNA
jgi:adenylate cyclase